MSSRKCGYCRELGHFAGQCPTKNNLIRVIRAHVGLQRKHIFRMLRESGWGVGAIVNGYSWYEGRNVAGIITAENLQNAVLYNNRMIEQNNVKYSKMVSARLISSSGHYPQGSEVDRIYRVNSTSISLSLTPLENVDPNSVRATVMVRDLGGPNLLRGVSGRDPWEQPAQLLSPSDDGEWTEVMENTHYRLHERLGGGYVTPLYENA